MTYLIAIFMLINIALVWSSAWLRGRVGYAATLGSLAAVLLCFEADLTTTSRIEGAFSVAGLLWIFFAFAYFVTTKYLTQTSVLDLTYQSHTALGAFLKERGNHSLLARLTLIAGPILFFSILLLGLAAAWAKSNGYLPE